MLGPTSRWRHKWTNFDPWNQHSSESRGHSVLSFRYLLTEVTRYTYWASRHGTHSRTRRMSFMWHAVNTPQISQMRKLAHRPIILLNRHTEQFLVNMRAAYWGSHRSLGQGGKPATLYSAVRHMWITERLINIWRKNLLVRVSVGRSRGWRFIATFTLLESVLLPTAVQKLWRYLEKYLKR